MRDETPDALTVTLSLAEWWQVKDSLVLDWWQSDQSDRVEAAIQAAIERGEAMAAAKEGVADV